MEKKLKIILYISIVILITLISFVGVYVKDATIFKNKIPEYLLSSEFEDKRIVSFVIDDGTEEMIYDKDGNKVSSIPDGANESEYKKETKKINADENFTSENYKLVKEIFDGRLKDLNVSDYKVRIDEENGKVLVELEENLNTDDLIQYLLCKGDFSISDSQSKSVLLNKSHIKKASVLYSNATSEGVTVYLDIKFNKEGTKKLQDISKEYLKPEDMKEEQNGTNNDDNLKKVTLTLEGNEMLNTYFDEEITTGELTISLGKGTDQEALQTYVEQGRFYAMLINNPEMPLTYSVNTSEVIDGNLTDTDIYTIVGVLIGISLLMIIYLIYRFKVDGVFAGISMIAWIGILLLIIRYTNTEISLNAIVGIILLIILDIYLLSKILSNIKKDKSYENVSKTTIKTYFEQKDIIIVTLIIAIVFTFMQYVQAFSFGMVLFYGAISIALTNLILLRTMLLAKYSNN